MNKKAIGAGIVIWFGRIVLLVITLYMLKVFISDVTGYHLNTHGLENSVLMYRIHNSPDGFIYTDPGTGRAYPGVIDPARFKQEVVEKLLAGEESFAIKVAIIPIDGDFNKEIYLNEEDYKIMEPLTFSRKYTKLEETQLALIKEGDDLKKARLVTSIVYKE